jgi:hypothetical protein
VGDEVILRLISGSRRFYTGFIMARKEKSRYGELFLSRDELQSAFDGYRGVKMISSAVK